MFILIPLILIFLLLAYVYLNDLSLLTEIIIYLVSILIGVFTYIIYRKIKYDLKLQEINALHAELTEYEKKLQSTQKESEKNTFERKINSIKNELEAK